jgi:hypothetical protein
MLIFVLNFFGLTFKPLTLNPLLGRCRGRWPNNPEFRTKSVVFPRRIHGLI